MGLSCKIFRIQEHLWNLKNKHKTNFIGDKADKQINKQLDLTIKGYIEIKCGFTTYVNITKANSCISVLAKIWTQYDELCITWTKCDCEILWRIYLNPVFPVRAFTCFRENLVVRGGSKKRSK